MYEISVTTRFSAAHHLAGYDGKCAVRHGHNWGVEVFIRGTELGDAGMLLDFKDLKAAVKGVLDEVDHVDLNEVPGLKGVNPSSENLARFLFGRLSAVLDCSAYRVARVSVHETPETGASYWED